MCDEKMSERKNKYHLRRRRRRCYCRCHRRLEQNNTELKAETHPNKVPSMMVSFVYFHVRFNQLLSFGSIIYHFHNMYFPIMFTSMAHNVSNPFSVFKIQMAKLKNLMVTALPTSKNPTLFTIHDDFSKTNRLFPVLAQRTCSTDRPAAVRSYTDNIGNML